jgi:hypothetical protein
MESHPFRPNTKPTHRPDHDQNYIKITQIHNYPTRHSPQEHHYIPNPNQYGQDKEPALYTVHLTQHYTEIWNALPETIRKQSKLLTFKQKLREHLLEKQSKE